MLIFFLGQAVFFPLLQMTNPIVLKVTYVTFNAMLKTLNICSYRALQCMAHSQSIHLHITMGI